MSITRITLVPALILNELVLKFGPAESFFLAASASLDPGFGTGVLPGSLRLGFTIDDLAISGSISNLIVSVFFLASVDLRYLYQEFTPPV